VEGIFPAIKSLEMAVAKDGTGAVTLFICTTPHPVYARAKILNIIIKHLINNYHHCYQYSKTTWFI